MSLRHIHDEAPKKKQKKKFDEFPELEQLLDDFDAMNNKGQKKKEIEEPEESVYIPKKPLPLPDFDFKDETPSHEENDYKEESSFEEYEEEIEEDFVEIEDDGDFKITDEMEEDSNDFSPIEVEDNDFDKTKEPQEEINEEVSPENLKVDKDNKNKDNKNKDNNFKELDDEKAKEFFKNFFSKFSKKDKGTQPKKDKEKKPKKEKEKKSKTSKKKTIIISSVIFVLILLGALFFIDNKSYSKLNGVSFELSDSELEVTDFSPSGAEKEVSVNLTNKGDVSKSVFFYVTLKEKGKIPFMSSEIECESDIIDIPSGETITQILKCSTTLEKNKKYKSSDSTVSEV